MIDKIIYGFAWLSMIGIMIFMATVSTGGNQIVAQIFHI